ncbi:hypothetical protein M8C21_006937, partial [Ambrosia artemisiifolia]
MYDSECRTVGEHLKKRLDWIFEGTKVLAEYTEFTGNFPAIATQCLQKLPSTNGKFTYNCDHHTFNFLVQDGYDRFYLFCSLCYVVLVARFRHSQLRNRRTLFGRLQITPPSSICDFKVGQSRTVYFKFVQLACNQAEKQGSGQKSNLCMYFMFFVVIDYGLCIQFTGFQISTWLLLLNVDGQQILH